MNQTPSRTRLVLVVEDDDGDAVLVERALAGSEFEPVRVESRQAALQRLHDAPCDAVLLDLSLPDSFGLEGVDLLHAQFPDLPVVVVTGLADEQLALDALNRGAQDYLVKGVWTPELLVRTLRYAIHRQAVHAENRRLMAELQRQARHDALTGLLTRHALMEELEREWSRACRTGQPLCCAMLDLDYFKRINDTYGHAAGDVALQTAAAAVRAESRQTDFPGRYGGEEFCVLLPGTSQQQAMVWAERVRARIAKDPLELQNTPLRLTASLGVAERTSTMSRPEALLERADQALRLAKQLGRNRVVAAERVASTASESAAFLSDQMSEGATAADLMLPPAAILSPATPLVEAAQHLLSMRTDALPVVDARGVLLGLVGEQDLASAMRTPHDWFRPVAEVMQQHPPCFRPDTPARAIREFLARNGVSQVVIVEEQRPVGLVSRFALLRWLYWCHLEGATTDLQEAETVGV
jgi:two-component system cell cycle response regulator